MSSTKGSVWLWQLPKTLLNLFLSGIQNMWAKFCAVTNFVDPPTCQFSIQNNNPATSVRLLHCFAFSLLLWFMVYHSSGVRGLEDKSFPVKVHILNMFYVIFAWFYFPTNRSSHLCHITTRVRGLKILSSILKKGPWSMNANQNR